MWQVLQNLGCDVSSRVRIMTAVIATTVKTIAMVNRFHPRPQINRCREIRFRLNSLSIKINFPGDFSLFLFIIIVSWKRSQYNEAIKSKVKR